MRFGRHTGGPLAFAIVLGLLAGFERTRELTAVWFPTRILAVSVSPPAQLLSPRYVLPGRG